MTTWSIVVPQGDWVETYPTTNGRIIQGIRLAAFYVFFILALIALILGIAVLGPAEKLAKVPWDVIDGFLQLLGWVIVGMMGVATAQFIGKRATNKPELVKAEGEVKAATIVAAAQAAAIAPKPAPTPAPSAAVIAMQTANAANAADPAVPIGASVSGEGD